MPQTDIQESQNYTVVPWESPIVRSFDDLGNATREQRHFYLKFKCAFLQREYIDLNGYTNYAFILLFDLLQSLDTATQQETKAEVKKALGTLSAQHPEVYDSLKTALQERKAPSPAAEKSAESHAGAVVDELPDLPAIIDITGQEPEIIDHEEHERLYGSSKEEANQHLYANRHTLPSDFDDWQLGNQYGEKLGFDPELITILNSINYSQGSFGDIEACVIEVLKLFRAVVKSLDTKLTSEGSSLSLKIEGLADLATRNITDHQKGSDSYKWFVQQEKANLYEYLLKRCDNAVRERYRYIRLKAVECPYSQKSLADSFRLLLEQPATAALQLEITSISTPDDETEIALNALTTTRWKDPFEGISEGLSKENAGERSKSIDRLAELNIRNPSLENIYYEASKALSNVDRELAVQFYLKYVSADTRSARIDAKPLTKTAFKQLFKNAAEAAQFEQIIAELRQSDNLTEALQKSAAIFEIKRKRISLDRDAIAQVRAQHAGTVGILNEIFTEDEAMIAPMPHPAATVTEEPPIVQTAEVREIQFTAGVSLSDVQAELIGMFAANGFMLTDDLISEFAKARATFKNGLINSVNEQCFELLDDNVIEESDNGYQLNSDYYHQLIS